MFYLRMSLYLLGFVCLDYVGQWMPAPMWFAIAIFYAFVFISFFRREMYRDSDPE